MTEAPLFETEIDRPGAGLARPGPERACDHCGLAVGRHPVGNDPWFCCSACATVYDALREAGLSDRYYRLRDVAPSRAPAPARTDEDQATLAELDSRRFIDQHTRLNEDGTRSADLFLDGVHCAACVWLLERLPIEVDGVREARLDLARARLSLRWDPDRVPLARVASWLARFGYTAHPGKHGAGSSTTGEERDLLIRTGVAWALAGNVMLITLAFYTGLSEETDSGLFVAGRWASLVLAIPSVAYAGAVFFRRAWRSLVRAAHTRSLRHLDMDTPIAVGLAVGMADSIRATFAGSGDVWFDSLTVLVAALLTARFLQLRSRRLAGDASDRLLSLLPTMARRLDVDGRIEDVDAESLSVGDRVLVAPGAVVPVDGTVESGESLLDRAIVTGESRPEPVGPGREVLAGVTNVTAELVIRVRAVGDDTRVGRLLTWVRDASSRRAPVVQLADRISGWFVVTVLLVAAATWLAWSIIAPDEAVGHVVALLVITCPCALGMATPLAMAVATGKAARRGIFIKSEAAIETLPTADVVVLDKTGTLTEGRPALVGVVGLEEVVPDVAVLERDIPHPIARALAAHLPDLPAAASDVVSEPGFGISGTIGAHRYVVGRPDWIESRFGMTPPELSEAAESAAVAGRTPVTVARDGLPVAVLSFGDRIRADAPRLVERLRDRGLDVRISSGDHPQVVSDVARAVGIPTHAAGGGVTPEDKKELVEALQTQGRRVVMVGDGVNDAAALSQADVGIAVAGGARASLVAADIFLTHGGLSVVEDLFTSAERVMHTIRRNLGMSLLYNLVVAALAVTGHVSPLTAAVAMPASSLAVVLSSILQRTFRSA